LRITLVTALEKCGDPRVTGTLAGTGTLFSTRRSRLGDEWEWYMGLHVFVGPTLPAHEVLGIAPEARLHPPVKNGDLIRAELRSGDVTVLIDGYFHQVGAVRHKEILDLLDRGVRVVGCSSMGALRGAELSPFGMIGNGTVFRMYAEGVIDGDGEVAVAHGEAPDYRSFTVVLVTIRHALNMATDIPAGDASALFDCARAMPYTERSWRGLERRAGQAGPAAERGLAALREFLARHPEHADIKAADATDTLTRLDTLLAERPAPRDWTASVDWRTRHLQDWYASFRGRTVDGTYVEDGPTARYRQIHDEDFPHVWRRYVLAQIAGQSALDGHALAEAALATAHARGLTFGSVPAPRKRAWLTSRELRELPEDDALLTILVRSYRRPSRSKVSEVMAALSDTDDTAARRAVARCHTDEPHAYLAGIWRTNVNDEEALRAAAHDHGLGSADEAVTVLCSFQTAERTAERT
jgi:hypothetical protein